MAANRLRDQNVDGVGSHERSFILVR